MDENEKVYQIDDPRFRITPLQQMAAACTGGMLTSLLSTLNIYISYFVWSDLLNTVIHCTVTPFDVVKVRLQAQQQSPTAVHKCFIYCNGLMDHICPCLAANSNSSQPYWYSRHGHFSGTLDAFLKISRSEGITSLWSGLSPTLVLALPATVVYFTIYEQLRSRLKYYSDQNYKNFGFNAQSSTQPFWVPLIAGCTARIWAVTIVSPLELMRTKMQSERLSYLQMNQALQGLVNQLGVRGLWKGAIPTLMRDVPFSGIYWVLYEKIKSFSPSEDVSFFHSFLGGCISGATAALVTNPFDVVKTLYQIDLLDKQIFTVPPGRNRTLLETLKRIYSEKGVSGWYAGVVPRLVKIVPACAIMVATFEMSKQYFFKRNVDRHMVLLRRVES